MLINSNVMESTLLTAENNRFHLHARDGLSSVQINHLVLENGQPFSQYPGLALTISDEANLVMWSGKLVPYCRPDTPTEAYIEESFAIWDQLTIGLEWNQTGENQPGSHLKEFSIRLFYTLNPDRFAQ